MPPWDRGGEGTDRNTFTSTPDRLSDPGQSMIAQSGTFNPASGPSDVPSIERQESA
jgi:hypothetical protein